MILHGLFQSSGSFVTSEDRSLAFWLAKQGGYQVYLAIPEVSSTWVTAAGAVTIRDSGVRAKCQRRFLQLTRHRLDDSRACDVRSAGHGRACLPGERDTTRCVRPTFTVLRSDMQIAFIGHSQGNGLAFISLSLGMCPSLGKRLSVFIALAPAVYAGPLTTGFPFTTLNRWSGAHGSESSARSISFRSCVGHMTMPGKAVVSTELRQCRAAR